MIRRPPRSTLFPYTTLFRSKQAEAEALFLAHQAISQHIELVLEARTLLEVLAEVPAVRNAEPTCATSLDRLQKRYSWLDRKSTRLNSSHANISYAVFCLKKK